MPESHVQRLSLVSITEVVSRLPAVGVSLVFLFFCFFILVSKTVCISSDGLFQDQIKIIESNLSREKQKYKKFDSREKNLLLRVTELEQEVAEKKYSIDKLGKKIRLSKKEIKNCGMKLTRQEKLLRETEIKAAKRLVVLYKYARKGYIKPLADVVNMEQLWQRVIYLRAISAVDRKDLAKLAAESFKYNKSISQIKKQLVNKEAVEKEENKRLANMREGLEEKVIHLMRIHKEKEFYETAVKELQLGALDLKSTFANIEKKKKYKATWLSRFADFKHKLPFPLKGEFVKGEKFLGSKNRNFSKGIFIEGFDSEVKAVFPGRVDFSGQLKGYGEIILINHGSRFFTISAQLFQRMKKEGEKVELGDIIALVNRKGPLKKARVYFEIRKGGKSVDPLVWLKKR